MTYRLLYDELSVRVNEKHEICINFLKKLNEEEMNAKSHCRYEMPSRTTVIQECELVLEITTAKIDFERMYITQCSRTVNKRIPVRLFFMDELR